MKLKEGTYYTYNNYNYGDPLNMVILAISDIRFRVIMANNNSWFKPGEECNYGNHNSEDLIKRDVALGILKEIDYET
jgi:hypothetical protein